MRIALISDTHDLVRAEVLANLEGADGIIHCGDVCMPRILDTLRSIAPLYAIRGNCDRGAWAEELPETALWQFDDIRVYAIHDLSLLDIDPAVAGIHVVLHGHTHKPSEERRDGVLYFNPGSAGPRRFQLPIAMGFMEIAGQELHVRCVELCAP